MRVLVDLQGAQGFGAGRGIGRYTLELSRALFALNQANLELFFLINFSVQENLENTIDYLKEFCPRGNMKGFFVPDSGDFETRSWRQQAKLIRSVKIKEVNPDAIILTSLFEPLGSRVLSEIDEFKCYQIVILYDLIPYEDPETYLTREKDRKNYKRSIHQLLKSDLILSISNYTTNIFLKNFCERFTAPVVTIGAATEKKISPGNVLKECQFDALGKFGIEKEFILTISGQDKRKNLKTLLLAFSSLPHSERKRIQLVVVCDMESSVINSFEDEFAFNSEIQNEVVFTGPVKEDDLDLLYSNCKLFVFPSTMEGFGLPVLEAMSFGCPCVVSNSTSLPELVGDAAVKFDANNVPELKRKISELIFDTSKLNTLSKLSVEKSKQYDWSDVAEKAARAIRSLKSKKKRYFFTSQGQREGLKAKKKLAYISPFPPEKTGISKYSSDLIPYLSKFYDIHCVAISNYPTSLANIHNRYFNVISKTQFKEKFLEYERVLYHFGNSEFHLPYFELLENYPGVVVLHEVFLDGLCALRDDHFQMLFDSHGASSTYALFSQKFAQRNSLTRYPCSLEVVDQSLGLIVHSKFAKRLLTTWYGSEISRKCKLVPFLKENKPLNTEIRESEFYNDEVVVCSFGYLGPGKMNLQLFDAWSNSISDQSKLVFVGPDGDEDYAAELKKKVMASGNGDKVIFTGWVSEEDYNYWLSVATVGVQLRIGSRGETSASLFDCMANGVPAIVNVHGDTADFPEDIVHKLKGNSIVPELIAGLRLLVDNVRLRRNLSLKSREYLTKNHSPEYSAKKYFSIIENFYSDRSFNLPLELSRLKSSNMFKTEGDLDCFINALLKTSLPSFRPKTLFIDVSEIIRGDIRTGIQRVVRNLTRAFTDNNVSKNGLRIEPVYSTDSANQYFCAGTFLTRLFQLPVPLEDRPIEAKAGDIFLGLDLQPIIIPKKKGVLLEMQARGVSVQFIVYDILPLTHREYFSPGVYQHFFNWVETISLFEKLLCISDTTRGEIERFLQVFFPERLDDIELHSFLLGNEITDEDASKGEPKNAEKIRGLMKLNQLYLTVGTLEPRKGHEETLKVFDLLWSRGDKVAIVFVGKKGWEIDELVRKIKNHRMFGRQLFWLDDCSDEFLIEIYENASGLVVSSRAEGYSLPIVESQNFGMPVFARDIAVFREIGQTYNNITFYDGEDVERIAAQFTEWKTCLRRRNRGENKGSKTICWKKATKDLQKIIIG